MVPETNDHIHIDIFLRLRNLLELSSAKNDYYENGRHLLLPTLFWVCIQLYLYKIYIYIYMYIYIYIHIFIYTCIYIYIYIFIYTCIYICIYTCMYIYIYKCVWLFLNNYQIIQIKLLNRYRLPLLNTL